MSTLFLCLLDSSRRPFRALKMRPVRQEAVHSLWSRLFCGSLKMRRVPEKAVLSTEYPFRTVEACFEHRVLLKMRRVPQEAFLSTARIFRTIGGPLWYRVPSKEQGKGPPETSSALAGDEGNGGRGRSEQSERSPLRGKLLPLRNFELYKERGRPLVFFVLNFFYNVEPPTRSRISEVIFC